LLTENGEQAGQIPAVRHVLFAFDVDEQAKAGVTAEFIQTGLPRGVAEEDGQQQAAPQDAHGILVAAVVSSLAQQVQEALVGDGSQQGVDSREGRGIGPFVPREEGSAQSRRQGKTSREKVLAEKTGNLSPPHRRVGVKIAKKR
jgi:hypothetical protein